MSQRTTRSAAQKAMDAMDTTKGGVEDVSKVAKEDVSKAQTSLSNDTAHFSLIRAMHLADLITEMNGFCGVMSVFSSMRYMALGDNAAVGNIYAALAFIPLGFFFDAMDGAVARSRRTSSLMGQELDSLADLISFGLSPACAAFALGFSTPLDHLILIFFVLCGLTRLARFNVSVDNVPRDANGKSKYFEGTPIPTTMAIAGMMAYWVSKGWVGADLPLGTVGSGWCEVHPALAVFVLWGVGMTSKSIHVPKPSIPGM